MQFEHRIHLQVPAPQVWQFLWNVPNLVACIPGCREARPSQEPGQWLAVVEEQAGPFRVRFDLDIHVKEMQEPRYVKVEARGKDTRLASQIQAALEVQLEPVDSQATELVIRVDAAVFGKLGTLGHSMIRRKGQEILDGFTQAIRAQLQA